MFTATTCRKLTAAACTSVFALAVGTAPAVASETAPAPEANPASASTNRQLAVCPGQTFAQPFAEMGDSNYYTLVEGSQFGSTTEGWTLVGGAKIVEGTRPDGSQGGTLELPSGSIAVSPPVCVTLQYPTARTWVDSLQNGGTLKMVVAYEASGLKAATAALQASVGTIATNPAEGWQLSEPFELNPQLAGSEEGVRTARFVYTAVGRKADFHVFGLYVDPRFGP